MRNKKRFVTAISLLAFATVFAGCSSNNDSDSSASSSGQPASEQTASPSASEPAASADPLAKPQELSVAIWDIQDGFDNPEAKNDTIYNDLTKKLNITVKPVQITWNDWQEKEKVWAASAQLPDIFANAIATDNRSLYSTWAKQGVLKALPDDLSAYPNIAQVMELPSAKPLTVDGKFYMVPRVGFLDGSSAGVMDRPILYRKDWAAQAGYTSDPNSYEEFVAMVKAVMAQHPDATGIAINNKDYLLTPMLGSFPELASMKDAWVNEDGTWIPAFASAKAPDAVKQIWELYHNGLLDKDFAIQKDADGFRKFLNGQAFISLGGNIRDPNNIEAFAKANPDAKVSDIGYMSIWPTADGNRYNFGLTPYWSETFFSNKLDDEKFDRALRLVDYMMSEEYSALISNGIEGVDYKLEDGKAVSLLGTEQTLVQKYPITSKFGYLASWHSQFEAEGKKVVNANPNVAAIDTAASEAFNRFKSENKASPINFEITLMSTPAKDKLAGALTPNNGGIVDELFNVVLSKSDPVEAWKKVVKSYDAKGLQDAITEVNAEAKEMGIQ
ncbi:type 2 periplasmic-binding domain-containing protein [Cohnella fermenti]|uniref:Extracellular solute-binding protein n=1 Tax=Cohnella fermenti TaxID=2565925 RepID=A0A4S4C7I3_9BACL|nr:extracellular solute-binding protein [Cohnella fermenti]THF83239.1 extracellular solute-binding protein [Cohnella fermenti]